MPRSLSSMGKRVNMALARDDYPKAREFAKKALARAPEDHWFLTRVATTYYVEGKCPLALRYSDKAVRQAPNCPLVLWDRACTLYMLGRHKEAIAICTKLLRKGATRLAHDECGEGLRWTLGLLNDCRYLMAEAYHKLGESALALRYARAHLRNRRRGVFSVQTKAHVRAFVSQLQGKGLR